MNIKVMEKELPKRWSSKNLKEVVKYQKGKKPKNLSENYFENSVPYLDIHAFEKGIIRQYADIESSNLIDEKSIGVVWDGARSGWVTKGQKGAIGSTIAKLSPIDVNIDYLFHFLKSKFQLINTNARGVGIPHVDPVIFWNLEVPLPPLPEQERIVDKLDCIFAHLEVVKQGLEKIPLLLKQFRQAVLAQAYSKPNQKVLLKDCTIKIQDGAHHSPKNQYLSFEIGLYPYITSKNIRNNYMDLSKIVYVDKEYHDSIYSRCKPEIGDVLLTKDGANTGNVTLNTFDQEFSLLSSVCLIKTNKEKLSSTYLKYYIQSPIGLQELLGEMSGTAIKRIVLNKIKNTSIPLPQLEEQIKIVRHVEDLFSKADAIEMQYKKLKEQIDQLPQAILAKAFRGEV